MRPPSATQSRAVAVAPAPRGFPVVACPESIARGIRCLLLTHISITPVLPRAQRAAILSFDDGYHDFIEYALPLLDKYGLRANQNLVISSVESGLPPWETRITF